MFQNDLTKQGVKVNQVKFVPPAGGDEAVLEALDYLETEPVSYTHLEKMPTATRLA